MSNQVIGVFTNALQQDIFSRGRLLLTIRDTTRSGSVITNRVVLPLPIVGAPFIPLNGGNFLTVRAVNLRGFRGEVLRDSIMVRANFCYEITVENADSSAANAPRLLRRLCAAQRNTQSRCKRCFTVNVDVPIDSSAIPRLRLREAQCGGGFGGCITQLASNFPQLLTAPMDFVFPAPTTTQQLVRITFWGSGGNASINQPPGPLITIGAGGGGAAYRLCGTLQALVGYTLRITQIGIQSDTIVSLLPPGSSSAQATITAFAGQGATTDLATGVAMGGMGGSFAADGSGGDLGPSGVGGGAGAITTVDNTISNPATGASETVPFTAPEGAINATVLNLFSLGVTFTPGAGGGAVTPMNQQPSGGAVITQTGAALFTGPCGSADPSTFVVCGGASLGLLAQTLTTTATGAGMPFDIAQQLNQPGAGAVLIEIGV